MIIILLFNIISAEQKVKIKEFFGTRPVVTRRDTEYFNLNDWARDVDKINRQDLTRLIMVITSRVFA